MSTKNSWRCARSRVPQNPPARAGGPRTIPAPAGSSAAFEQGNFDILVTHDDGGVDTVTCSLVLHQVPLAEKARLLQTMLVRLRPGGQLFIADYGLQPNFIMRLAYRLTVQMLDGKSDTQPNADGILPILIEEAGFVGMRVLDSFDTATGKIDIIRAEKPQRAQSEAQKR